MPRAEPLLRPKEPLEAPQKGPQKRALDGPQKLARRPEAQLYQLLRRRVRERGLEATC